ncbi:putative dihydrofolate reductase, Thymidylate synthase [Helianthus annuus]|uniref:dihydrofolate reductase n=1 Tax=Helianthus annuus TaxID=4232 RepID=A0A251SBZ0_HELAN|nr:bifunctional dihydrofolate reductase-thymidylate synthase [Helianthus annuus]KAF5765923.1 putative dihydrofolate reductase, Thymidylate synthase [Helianthus annuus]KAJ0474286.1 putative dihydrofolate reductase, Thymidylate synthase [Helianthus annuus]
MFSSRIVNKHNFNGVLSTSSRVFREYSIMKDCNMHPDSQRTYQVVVAATRDMGIGKNGNLPWKLPSDLKFFKEITTSTSGPTKKNAVIMGRKTWDSIPLQYRPLSGRLNVVLTRSTTCNVATSENVVTCGSIPSALELLASSPYSSEIDKVFVIGGGQILREAMNGPGCEAIHMTEIDANIDCDTFIPRVDLSFFRPWCSSLPVTENDISYRFVSYVRVCSSSDSNKLKLENFAFLPKIIFDKHEEFMYPHQKD